MTQPADDDGRMSFDEAMRFVGQHPDKAAFAAMPVFGERTDNEEQRAEGARIFVLQADGAGGLQMRFIAGPFFANAFAAHETLTAAEIPERARELRFLPTRVDEEWLGEQVQIVIQKLMQESGKVAPQMPDYAAAPLRSGEPDAVPVSFIGRRDPQR